MKATLLVLLLATFAAAQDNHFVASKSEQHRFLDKKNIALFSAVAAVRIADMDSTWRFRAKRCEYHPAQYFPDGSHLFAYTACGPASTERFLTNSFVDNKPAFAAYSIGMVGLQILASYELHRRGFHRMERLSEMIHVGYIGGWAIANYRINNGVIPQTITRYP